MGGMILLLSILGMFNMMISFLPSLLMIRNMEELTSVYLIFPKDFPTHNVYLKLKLRIIGYFRTFQSWRLSWPSSYSYS